MDQITIGIICGVVGGLAVLIIALVIPAQKCPQCREKLPKFGGSKRTCKKCGCVVNKSGKKI